MKAALLSALAVVSVSTASFAGNGGASFGRRAAFAAELMAEGSFREARLEAERLRTDFPEEAARDARIALLSGGLEGLEFSFRNASDPVVYRLAGCALHILFAEDPALAARYPELAEDIALCEGVWLPEDFTDARDVLGIPPPRGNGGAGGWLSRRVVGFYKTFIGPAIGDRCVLEPSCSAYFVQASRKHGLLGVPMTADRFVREPVVSAPDRPWVRNAQGKWRHPDPVGDHDWWF